MKYYRDTYLEINLNHVLYNITHLLSLSGDMKFMAVIKADSYGHGALMIAKTLNEAGVGYFAVATVDEAIELRRAKITCPILVFGSVPLRSFPLVSRYHLSISVNSIDWLKKAMASYHGDKINVHIKLDSGMGRLGFNDKAQFLEAYHLINISDHWHVEGIYSHLANSEDSDETYYQMQVSRFESMLEGVDLTNLLIHIGNSASLTKPKPKYVNMVRVGLMINGQKPGPLVDFKFEPKQSISLYSTLVQVKKVLKGEKLSYNGIYQTEEDEYIGTIPIGYADGFDRRLKNGRVYIDGEFCQIVGRICMDYCLVKLPKELPEGTQVELLGPHISVDEYAKKIGTNNYQATCILSDRLPRIYLKDGKVIKVINRRLMTKTEE